MFIKDLHALDKTIGRWSWMIEEAADYGRLFGNQMEWSNFARYLANDG